MHPIQCAAERRRPLRKGLQRCCTSSFVTLSSTSAAFFPTSCPSDQESGWFQIQPDDQDSNITPPPQSCFGGRLSCFVSKPLESLRLFAHFHGNPGPPPVRPRHTRLGAAGGNGSADRRSSGFSLERLPRPRCHRRRHRCFFYQTQLGEHVPRVELACQEL